MALRIILLYWSHKSLGWPWGSFYCIGRIIHWDGLEDHSIKTTVHEEIMFARVCITLLLLYTNRFVFSCFSFISEMSLCFCWARLRYKMLNRVCGLQIDYGYSVCISVRKWVHIMWVNKCGRDQYVLALYSYVIEQIFLYKDLPIGMQTNILLCSNLDILTT
jgi:hypothetical protein